MKVDDTIRAKCFHPAGTFVEFRKEEIEQSIPDRFEQMVRLYPDRVAVKTRNHQLTYDALNKSANRVARAVLETCGEGEEPVALLLDHDVPLIATILGVLKAGKIYVPLDPSFPHAKIASILEDSQASLLITDNKKIFLALELARSIPRLLNIDILDSRLSNENVGQSLSPDVFAYILYTSGSTGKPKGLIQNHRNVLHNTMICTNNLHICSDDGLTLLHSCVYGASINNLFGALLNGGALFPFDVKKEGLVPLANLITEGGVTIYHSVPTVFRNFVHSITGAEDFSKLRLIHLSGAPATKKDVELYRNHFSADCIFVHRLGSTEANTVFLHFIDKDSEIAGRAVPVGYAVDDKKVLVVNEGGNEVRPDEIGEIVIKSRFLSPGYWHDVERTQATFLPDPNGGDERGLRTGDLGCMLLDGRLVHLGRKDFQIKIRGYRIEAAEIEMALLDIAGIKEAVVVAREDLPSDPSASPRTGKRLVAYVVPTGKPAPTVSALRRAITEKLPDYMIPSVFVKLDALPLTPNGKVDRIALPVPSSARPELDTSFVAPTTPIEEELAEIWAEVVGVDQVGIHDNFFDLGGHSLLATQVISRVINTFKVELPIRFLFESPTVADMALVITENMAKKVGDKELARMLAELESLSDEETQQRLAEEGK